MLQWNPFQEMETFRREIDHAFLNFGLLTAPAFRSAFLPGRAAREYPLPWCADVALASRRKSQATKDQRHGQLESRATPAQRLPRDKKEGRWQWMAQLLPERWRHALSNLRSDIQHALERWLPGRQRLGSRTGEWTPSSVAKAGPVLTVEETDNEIIMLAEMPGLDKENFSLELTADRLVLRGEKRHAVEEQRGGYSYSERRFGAFARVIPLPCAGAVEKAPATDKNGLLRISLPKMEWARVKRVQVHIP